MPSLRLRRPRSPGINLTAAGYLRRRQEKIEGLKKKLINNSSVITKLSLQMDS
jgi:hypothetical protein